MLWLALALTAAPQAASPQPCSAEIRTVDGAPRLFVNGQPEPAYAYLIHMGDKDRHYRQMAEAGVRIYSVSASIGNTPDGFDPDGLTAPFEQVTAARPDALIFPRVGVTAPGWWLERRPEERVKFADGSVGPQSMFSEAWLEDACRWVEDYSRYIRNSPVADHAFGIHLCSGGTAEWQSWGLWENKRGDFSEPALRAWRAYLEDKYGTDAALSEAWGRPASIGEATIPSRAEREAEASAPRDPDAFQRVMDFYDFYWRGTAKAITELAAAAKRGGGQDWLVGVFYGYLPQYGGKMQESQHLGIETVLESPDIDFLCSPAMYSDRGPGGASNFMSFTESIKRRGKLWWHEADNRTHRSIGDPFGKVAPAQNLFESVNVLEREFAHCLTEAAGLWWFDMGGGWYDEPELMERVAATRALAEEDPERLWKPDVEIGLFIDAKSSYRMPPESPYLHGMTQLVAAMPRLGAPYRTYLLSDLPEAPAYRALLLPNAFDLTDHERAAIEQRVDQGATVVCWGPAGAGRFEAGRVTPAPDWAEALSRRAEEGPGRVLARKTPSAGDIATLREALEAANVRIYTSTNDAFYIGEGYVALHAASAGVKKLEFGEPLEVTEVLAAPGASVTADEVEARFERYETRVWRLQEPR